MKLLRRWVPGAAAAEPARTPAARPEGLRRDDFAEKDLAFCSELAFHGGVALSEQGFNAEPVLVRMQRAGLLELQRHPDPPFAVIRVALSPAARALLSGQELARPPSDPRHVAEPLTDIPSTAGAQPDRNPRRHGFEVARGMIGAAVKSELASWCSAGRPGGEEGLETQLLIRISQIVAPFQA